MERVTSGRPEVGTVLDLEGFGRCRVESNADPSAVILTAPGGGSLRVGERALVKLVLEREASNGDM